MSSTGHDHGIWTSDHVYMGAGAARAEKRTRFVVWLTTVFMVVEVAAGFIFGSMALLADGVHMATHIGALGLAAGAYWLARRHAADARFSFGSGKFGDLAAFSSALLLGLSAFGIAAESIMRLQAPQTVQFGEALIVAVLGLVVNLVCAAALHEPNDEKHHHHHHHRDLNLRAAYIHVLTDALTSVLAIAALAAGMLWGLVWLDPTAGLFGAGVIAVWACRLICASGRVLLDAEDDPAMAQDIRSLIEEKMGAHVADLHLWRVGPGHRALIDSLICPDAQSAEEIKRALKARFPGLSHVTVEVSVCAECAP